MKHTFLLNIDFSNEDQYNYAMNVVNELKNRCCIKINKDNIQVGVSRLTNNLSKTLLCLGFKEV